MARIGKNQKDKGQVTTPSEYERILGQIARGEVRAGPKAAREIAAKIQAKGGFWGPPK